MPYTPAMSTEKIKRLVRNSDSSPIDVTITSSGRKVGVYASLPNPRGETVTIDDVPVSAEALRLIFRPDPNVWLRFEREGDIIRYYREMRPA